MCRQGRVAPSSPTSWRYQTRSVRASLEQQTSLVRILCNTCIRIEYPNQAPIDPLLWPKLGPELQFKVLALSDQHSLPARLMLRQLWRVLPHNWLQDLQLLEIDQPQVRGCRQFAQWRGTQRMEGNIEKKRRRRAENARLRDWAAREDQISWVADRQVDDTSKASGGGSTAKDDRKWNAWRRMQSDYSSRRNNDKGAPGNYTATDFLVGQVVMYIVMDERGH